MSIIPKNINKYWGLRKPFKKFWAYLEKRLYKPHFFSGLGRVP